MRRSLMAVVFGVPLMFAALPLMSVLVMGAWGGSGTSDEVLVPAGATDVQLTATLGGTGGGGGGETILGFRLPEAVAVDEEDMTAVAGEGAQAALPASEGGHHRYGFRAEGTREKGGCEGRGGVSSGT